MERRLAAHQITTGVIWKQLLFFFFPILLGTFFQQMYSTVDTVVVGRFVGTQALAAVGATAALISLINGFFIGLSTGATVLMSQFFGANDRSGIHNAMHTGMGLSILLGILVTALGLTLSEPILILIGTPENCLSDALLYTRIYFSGSLFSMVYNMGSGILRAMGDSRRPMLFLIAACFINIVLDLAFVVALDMGIAGAAAATIGSQALSAVLVLLTLLRQPEGLGLHLRQIRLNGQLLQRILYVGIPAGLQFITFDLANLLIQSGVNSFGDVTVAAWTAYIKTDGLTWMISGAFGVSITTFVGQNFGAQKYDRIRKSVWVCMGMAISLIGLLSLLILTFRHTILGIYTTDQSVIQLGACVMLWTIPFNFLFMPVEVFAGTFRGTGYSLMPTLITCGCVCVFRVIWIFTVVRLYHRIELLAVCYPISWLLADIVFFIAYFRGTWLHSRIAACGMEPEVIQ